MLHRDTHTHALKYIYVCVSECANVYGHFKLYTFQNVCAKIFAALHFGFFFILLLFAFLFRISCSSLFFAGRQHDVCVM